MSDDSRVFLDALINLGFDVRPAGNSMTGSDESAYKKKQDKAFREKPPFSDMVDIRITGEGGRIPKKKVDVYVGSAGTAARFLTAMTALSDGEYELTSSDQMKKRPMRPLIEALEALGTGFIFHENEYEFPFRVTGAMNAQGKASSLYGAVDDKTNKDDQIIPLNIDESSQFLSALLLVKPMAERDFSIKLTGQRKAVSYVRITARMMREFGYTKEIGVISDDGIRIDDDTSENGRGLCTRNSRASLSAKQTDTVKECDHYTAREYMIEPDVSAACYFYAMAALNGGRAHVRGVNRSNPQGDMRFIELLEKMGCGVSTMGEIKQADGNTEAGDCPDTADDIVITRDKNTPLHGADVCMSDFSDQTMTLAAIAPFADSGTTIRGVGHIRRQESDRIHAIVTELNRLGVRCEEYDDGLKIWPVIQDTARTETLIHTYGDHRMAMAFAVTGTYMDGVIIDDPECCRKTFDSFFDILDNLFLKRLKF